MLSDFLNSVPKQVEHIDSWGIFFILFFFILNIFGTLIINWFFEVNGENNPYNRWKNLSYVIFSIATLFFPSWILARGFQGPFGMAWILIPLAISFILCRYVVGVEFKRIPWRELLGAGIVCIFSGIIDYISEKLYSIPMTWGLFLALVMVGFAFAFDDKK